MTLFVRSFGTGPDLVFLHGWGFHGGIWDNVVTPLVELGYRIHVVDLPGHGNSPVSTMALTVDSWAEAVRDTIPTGSTWVGWSLGGMVALAAAALDPGGIRALILVGASPRFVRGVDWPAAVEPKLLAEFERGLRDDWHATLSRFLTLQTRSTGQQALGRCSRAAMLSLPPAPSALTMGLTLLQDTDLRPRLLRITCPTLVLLGEMDTLVPAAMSKDLAQLRPTWEIRRIAGAGHLLFLTHQPEFLAALINHVSRI